MPLVRRFPFPLLGNLSSLTGYRFATKFDVSRTGHEVIVYHSGRLHQRVADCRGCKFESTPQQVAVHRIGFRSSRRYLGHRSPAILDRLATNETPQINVESPRFFAHGEKRFRVLDRGRDL